MGHSGIKPTNIGNADSLGARNFVSQKTVTVSYIYGVCSIPPLTMWNSRPIGLGAPLLALGVTPERRTCHCWMRPTATKGRGPPGCSPRCPGDQVATLRRNQRSAEDRPHNEKGLARSRASIDQLMGRRPPHPFNRLQLTWTELEGQFLVTPYKSRWGDRHLDEADSA